MLDADTGTLVTHIDVTPHGAVNAIAVLDLTTNTFTEIIGLGAKDSA